MGESFEGIVVTDRYSAYHWRASERCPLCWAPLLRDFQRIAHGCFAGTLAIHKARSTLSASSGFRSQSKRGDLFVEHILRRP